MASDDFTNTNGVALAIHNSDWASIGGTGTSNNWPVGNFEIQANACDGVSTFNKAGARNIGSTDVNFCEVVIKAAAYGQGDLAVCIQATSTRAGYNVIFEGLTGDVFSTMSIYEDNGTSNTWIDAGSGSFDRTADIKVKVELTGGNLIVTADDVEIINVAEGSALTGGDPGFYKTADYEETQAFDDWTDGVGGGGGGNLGPKSALGQPITGALGGPI